MYLCCRYPCKLAKLVIKGQVRFFNAFPRFCMPYILPRWQNNQKYAPTTDFYLNQLFERIHNIFETYSNSTPSPWLSREATPVGRAESRIICAETDSPYVSAAAAAAVGCEEQIYRTYLWDRRWPRIHARSFQPGSGTGLWFGVFFGPEDTCTSWPFQWKVMNISQPPASCFFKLMYN